MQQFLKFITWRLCSAQTCFGCPDAHQQELQLQYQPLLLPLERGGSSVVGRGRAGRPDHDQQHCCLHAPTVKTEVATAVVVTPADGREDARNMLSWT
jgi:hypothetical protein